MLPQTDSALKSRYSPSEDTGKRYQIKSHRSEMSMAALVLGLVLQEYVKLKSVDQKHENLT